MAAFTQIEIGGQTFAFEISSGWFVTSASTTTSTTSISLSTITVPTNAVVRVGDFIIASNGLVFLISAVGSSSCTVTYKFSLKGATGPTGPAGTATVTWN